MGHTNKTKLWGNSILQWKVHPCSFTDLIDMYVQQVETMSEHTFLASWNYVQFKKCKNNLQIGDVLIINDLPRITCVYTKMSPKVCTGNTNK